MDLDWCTHVFPSVEGIERRKQIKLGQDLSPFDFKDTPIGTCKVRMHSTKKSKKKTKKKEKLGSTVPEPPAPRYNPAFLAKIFNKNRETNIPQGTNPVTTTTPTQSSNVTQQAKTNVKSQQDTSRAPQMTTTPTTTPFMSKQKTPILTPKGPSSSVGNAANVTPAQLTPVTSQTATKPTPAVKMQHQTGGYYLKLAARKYNHSTVMIVTATVTAAVRRTFPDLTPTRSQRVKNGRHPKKSQVMTNLLMKKT
jgi:hypothetical protein